MKFIKITLFLFFGLSLTNCASRYQTINPTSVNYVSKTETKGIQLEYRYSLLERKYSKKEIKKGVKVVAFKITNHSDKDIIFGDNVTFKYTNGEAVQVLETEQTFKTLKQQSALYLLYLLLTPVNFYTSTTNSYGVEEQTSSTPIGLVLGPGIAAGNVIQASSANKKFKTELQNYDLNGTVIKPGETKHGLIGIKSFHHDTLKLNVE
ncbi:hypothetical protein [Aestuariibaculum suncheonense]|uniref:Lipoprotein n=1 Tax=Aestuariibaculum suncheonense TaxID=1028745 RepID=A0A8J6Q5F2_9FLAO|nr:hypothetical protein [Aestuariibaculum suncheonense]MBD0834401.1 hypothetical protein [Aestuariibaculum suncheonense]